MPYLAMGAVLVFVYVWTGKNVMFAYFVHASKNLLAVIFIYAIPPDLLEQLQQCPALTLTRHCGPARPARVRFPPAHAIGIAVNAALLYAGAVATPPSSAQFTASPGRTLPLNANSRCLETGDFDPPTAARADVVGFFP